MNLPEIKAEFILDKEGKPKGRSSEQYAIRLSVENTPKDTHAVTYYLHSSYYDPVREVRDQASHFCEELTSYGDFDIQVKVRTRDHSILTKRSLYEALAESHGQSSEPTIKEALQNIHDN